jgi:DNA-binding transcriptional regulator YbjK
MTASKSTVARRDRNRATTRAGIVEIALGVLESGGAGALTMRRIATDVDYAAPII